MVEEGVAHKQTAYVNWDPVAQTVLANEQIDADGKAWRTGAIAEKKELQQWTLDIRKYADEMLEDLDKLQRWPQAVRDMQRGWIGKSEGTSVKFGLEIEG